MAMNLDDLKKRVQPWLEPVSADAPAGRAAKFEPQYEAVLAEVGKLESPTGGAVDWPRVIENGEALLKGISKDLVASSYMAFGLYVTKGLPGLLDGATLLAELMDGYWANLFPEVARLRARSNALTWFVTRASQNLAAYSPKAADRELVQGLELAAMRLTEVIRNRFESNGPAVGPMLQALERVKLSLPAEAPPPPPPKPPEPKPEVAPAVSQPAPSAPSSPAAPEANLASADQASEYLRQVGTSLAQAAGVLRRANDSDPTAYRLLRTGLWLHIVELPKSGPNGRTTLPALPAQRRAQFEQIANNGKWNALIEEVESALVQNRFNMDLQALTARALSALGPSHAAARQALLAELRGFLTRQPGVTDLLANDGTALTSNETKSWLQSEVLGSQGGAPAAASPAVPPAAEDMETFLAGVKKLMAEGKAPLGVQQVEARLQTLRSMRERFRLRLGLAKMCIGHGQLALARALFRTLDAESVAHGLERWEPELAAECLEGLLRTLRPPLPPDWQAQYQRLVQLSPSSALRVEADLKQVGAAQ